MAKNKLVREIAEAVVATHIEEGSVEEAVDPKHHAAKVMGHRGANITGKKVREWVGDKMENTDWDVDKLRAEAKKAGFKDHHVEKAITYHS